MLAKIIFLALIGLAMSANVTFTDCANKELQSIDVSTCTGNPCALDIGSTVTATIKFVANQDTPNVAITMAAQLGDLKLDVPNIEHNGCLTMTPSCPIKKGQTYTHTTTMPIPNLLPPNTPVSFISNLEGFSGVLSCGKVDVVVVA